MSEASPQTDAVPQTDVSRPNLGGYAMGLLIMCCLSVSLIASIL